MQSILKIHDVYMFRYGSGMYLASDSNARPDFSDRKHLVLALAV